MPLAVEVREQHISSSIRIFFPQGLLGNLLVVAKTRTDHIDAACIYRPARVPHMSISRMKQRTVYRHITCVMSLQQITSLDRNHLREAMVIAKVLRMFHSASLGLLVITWQAERRRAEPRTQCADCLPLLTRPWPYPGSSPALTAIHCQLHLIMFFLVEHNLHPSTFSGTYCGTVHRIASSDVCVLSSLQTAFPQRALRARWSESPFHPNM